MGRTQGLRNPAHDRGTGHPADVARGGERAYCAHHLGCGSTDGTHDKGPEERSPTGPEGETPPRPSTRATSATRARSPSRPRTHQRSRPGARRADPEGAHPHPASSLPSADPPHRRQRRAALPSQDGCVGRARPKCRRHPRSLRQGRRRPTARASRRRRRRRGCVVVCALAPGPVMGQPRFRHRHRGQCCPRVRHQCPEPHDRPDDGDAGPDPAPRHSGVDRRRATAAPNRAPPLKSA